MENFLPAPELQTVLASLQQQGAPGGEPLIYLSGPPDTGKSHLLQAACHRAGSGALYLPLADLVAASPEDVMQGMESLQLVCLDDLDAIAGIEAWERGLFHFFNRARECECRLLLSARGAPRTLPLQLPDLASRLSWGVVFQLAGLGDQRRQEILCFRARRRGLHLPVEVASFIVNRAPRAMGSLLELLAQLDAASLAEQRALSIPFVKRTLGW